MLLSEKVYLVFYRIQASENDSLNGERVVIGGLDPKMAYNIYDNVMKDLRSEAAIYEWTLLHGIYPMNTFSLARDDWSEWQNSVTGGSRIAEEINKVFTEYLYRLVHPIELA